MSGPITERTTVTLTPARPEARPQRPQTAADTLRLGQDELQLSKASALRSEASEADRIFDQAIRPALQESDSSRDVFVPAPIPPAPGKSPFAIQQLRFADRLNNGKETELSFEQYPGDLSTRPQPPVMINRDPLTGDSNLELREMRARLSGGDYDVYVKVKGDGSIGIDRIMKDGRNITSIAKDAVLEKIQEDPAIYGTLAAMAVAGAVVAARQYARKSGEGIEFDALSFKVLERDNFNVKTKLKAELTGGSSWVRPSSAEVAMHYGDERLEAYASTKYNFREDNWEASVGTNYKLSKNANLTTGAFYRSQRSDYGAFVGLSAVF